MYITSHQKGCSIRDILHCLYGIWVELWTPLSGGGKVAATCLCKAGQVNIKCLLETKWHHTDFNYSALFIDILCNYTVMTTLGTAVMCVIWMLLCSCVRRKHNTSTLRHWTHAPGVTTNVYCDKKKLTIHQWYVSWNDLIHRKLLTVCVTKRVLCPKPQVTARWGQTTKVNKRWTCEAG